ncbi:MAG: hypothetical protein RIS79_2606, partial [Verrucomicrobiota bacterium]
MSGQGMLHGWRSRVFYLTRDRRFLLRLAGTIVAAGFLIASLIVTARSGALPTLPPISAGEQRLQEEYGRLLSLAEKEPRRVATWLRWQMAAIVRAVEEVEEPRKAFDAFSQNGVVNGR